VGMGNSLAYASWKDRGFGSGWVCGVWKDVDEFDFGNR
jgi:hypothetical protein